MCCTVCTVVCEHFLRIAQDSTRSPRCCFGSWQCFNACFCVEFADETRGDESFDISSRWQEQGGAMFLLNQSNVALTGGLNLCVFSLFLFAVDFFDILGDSRCLLILSKVICSSLLLTSFLSNCCRVVSALWFYQKSLLGFHVETFGVSLSNLGFGDLSILVHDLEKLPRETHTVRLFL